MQTTGAILAGGRSTRFGSDKACARYRGGTLLERAVEAASSVCGRVVVSGNRDGWDCVGDRRAGMGPVGGVEAVLRHVGSGQVLFLTCDMPLVDAELLRLLVHDADGGNACFTYEGSDCPFPCLLSALAATEATRLLDEDGPHSMRSLFRRLDMRRVPLPEAQARKLANANRPADLEEMTNYSLPAYDEQRI